jgi:hypothetical protein
MKSAGFMMRAVSVFCVAFLAAMRSVEVYGGIYESRHRHVYDPIENNLNDIFGGKEEIELVRNGAIHHEPEVLERELRRNLVSKEEEPESVASEDIKNLLRSSNQADKIERVMRGGAMGKSSTDERSLPSEERHLGRNIYSQDDEHRELKR